jgi:Asp-tRNA(Asn)/Glu-tRNA(Gln) amidotransferase A subunit family amidase
VPSRLYSRHSPKTPLAGCRVALSDDVALQGVKTTLSSRAWADLNGPTEETDSVVSRLLKLSAVVVGKTKIPQLGHGREWVDFRSSGNPRGDGYLNAPGSCCGAAASLAGYPWLDFAVGLDGKLVHVTLRRKACNGAIADSAKRTVLPCPQLQGTVFLP